MLGSIGPVSGEFLPATLARFTQTYPHVDVSIKEIEPDAQIAQLENKQIQIAFTFNQAVDPKIPHLEHHVIFERERSCSFPSFIPSRRKRA